MQPNNQIITRLLNRILLSRDIPDEFDNVAGNFESSCFVLIGESPANPSMMAKYYPFRDTKGCSGWLNRLLDDENVQEKDLFWINAYHIDGSPNDLEILRYLKDKKIICLGKKAEEWLKPSGLKHDLVPHPQYWKRFRSKERYPLMDLLKT